MGTRLISRASSGERSAGSSRIRFQEAPGPLTVRADVLVVPEILVFACLDTIQKQFNF